MSRRIGPRKKKIASTRMWSHGHCKNCGEMLEDLSQQYCSVKCRIESEEKNSKKKNQSLFLSIGFIGYLAVIIGFVLFRYGLI
ncbi:MAG: DUF2116 family Zn-ribbon domain-containing protein [Candidatus Ranarchaeia archaeon]